jgi:hypothetical protein
MVLCRDESLDMCEGIVLIYQLGKIVDISIFGFKMANSDATG